MSGENPEAITANPADSRPKVPTTEEKMAALEAEIAKFHTAGGQLQATVNSLQNQLITALTKPTNKPHSSSMRLPPLDKYSGNRNDDLLSWLFQVNEQLSLMHDIDNDEKRIVFAGQALTGNAKVWYRAMRIEKKIKTWEDFEDNLKKHFYPVNPVKQARDQLHNLSQTTSVRDYTATFRHLCAIIDNISEDEKLDRYVRGLKTRTRGQVELKEPDTFDEACRLAEMIDVSNDRIFGSSRPTFSVATKPRRQGPEPMDLGAVPEHRGKPKFKKLSPEEKERRKKEGLCLYCGSGEHQLDGCPLRRPQGKAPQRPNRGA
jgi:plasmid maintenance system killer protein